MEGYRSSYIKSNVLVKGPSTLSKLTCCCDFEQQWTLSCTHRHSNQQHELLPRSLETNQFEECNSIYRNQKAVEKRREAFFSFFSPWIFYFWSIIIYKSLFLYDINFLNPLAFGNRYLPLKSHPVMYIFDLP